MARPRSEGGGLRGGGGGRVLGGVVAAGVVAAVSRERPCFIRLTADEWKRVVLILRGDIRPHPVDDDLLSMEIAKQLKLEMDGPR